MNFSALKLCPYKLDQNDRNSSYEGVCELVASAFDEIDATLVCHQVEKFSDDQSIPVNKQIFIQHYRP